MEQKLSMEPTTRGRRVDGGGDSLDGTAVRMMKPAKISFSKKVKMGSTLSDSPSPPRATKSLSERPNFELQEQFAQVEMFFARIGGFPGESMKWVAENLNRMTGTRQNVKGPENWVAAIHGNLRERAASLAIPIAKRRAAARGERRHLFFARVSSSADPDIREQVEDQVQETKEDVVDTAQQARVPVPSTRLPYIGFVNSLTIKTLVCGIIAGGLAATVTVPFDLVRTRALGGKGGQTTGQVLSTVINQEGIQSILKVDVGINVGKQALEKGLQFTTFEFVKRYQQRNTTSGRQKKVLPLPRQIPVATAGGAAAGFVGTVVGYPLQPMFDRMILDSAKYKSIWNAARVIVQNEGGVRELYRGITPALLSVVPSSAISFYTYETLKEKFLSPLDLKPHLEALGSLVIGAVAGGVSTTLVYPLELARKEILLSYIPSNAVQLAEGKVLYNNTFQALKGIAKSQGFRGLYRGLPAQNLQIMPMTAVTFMVYELAKRAIRAKGEEAQDEVKDEDDLE